MIKIQHLLTDHFCDLKGTSSSTTAGCEYGGNNPGSCDLYIYLGSERLECHQGLLSHLSPFLSQIFKMEAEVSGGRKREDIPIILGIPNLDPRYHPILLQALGDILYKGYFQIESNGSHGFDPPHAFKSKLRKIFKLLGIFNISLKICDDVNPTTTTTTTTTNSSSPNPHFKDNNVPDFEPDLIIDDGSSPINTIIKAPSSSENSESFFPSPHISNQIPTHPMQTPNFSMQMPMQMSNLPMQMPMPPIPIPKIRIKNESVLIKGSCPRPPLSTTMKVPSPAPTSSSSSVPGPLLPPVPAAIPIIKRTSPKFLRSYADEYREPDGFIYCDFCSYRQTQMNKVKCHLSSHFLPELRAKIGSDSLMTNKCFICGKVTSQRCNLIQHYAYTHAFLNEFLGPDTIKKFYSNPVVRKRKASSSPPPPPPPLNMEEEEEVDDDDDNPPKLSINPIITSMNSSSSQLPQLGPPQFCNNTRAEDQNEYEFQELPPRPKIRKSERNKVVCPFCPHKGSENSVIRRHIYVHFKKEIMKKIESENPNARTSLKCERCKSTFNRSSNLLYHYSYLHEFLKEFLGRHILENFFKDWIEIKSFPKLFGASSNTPSTSNQLEVTPVVNPQIINDTSHHE